MVMLFCLRAISMEHNGLSDDFVLQGCFDDGTAKDDSGNYYNGMINALKCVGGIKGRTPGK